MSAALQRRSRRTQLLAKEVVQNFLHRTALSVMGKSVPGGTWLPTGSAFR